MTTPKYLTTTQACSCPGYWYRRTCKHVIAYREAVALVQAQDVFNRECSPQSPIGVNLTPMGEGQFTHRGQSVPYRWSGQFTIEDRLSGMVKTIPERVLTVERLVEAQERRDIYSLLLR